MLAIKCLNCGKYWRCTTNCPGRRISYKVDEFNIKAMLEEVKIKHHGYSGGYFGH